MSLIVCPKCGTKFSEYAQSCPNCGLSIDKVKQQVVLVNPPSPQSGPVAISVADAQAKFESVQKLFEAKKYEQALTIVKELISMNNSPEYTDLKIKIEDSWLKDLKQSVSDLMDGKNYSLAIQYLKQAQSLAPDDLFIKKNIDYIHGVRKHKLKIWIGIILLILFICACITGFILYKNYQDKLKIEEDQRIKQEQIDKIKAEAEAEKERIKKEAEAEVKKARERAIDDSYYYSDEEYVVITGTNLRLRYSPSTDGETYKWPDGTNKHPKVGEKLKYLGETDDWYKVLYDDQILWVSKLYSHIY